MSYARNSEELIINLCKRFILLGVIYQQWDILWAVPFGGFLKEQVSVYIEKY